MGQSTSHKTSASSIVELYIIVRCFFKSKLGYAPFMHNVMHHMHISGHLSFGANNVGPSIIGLPKSLLVLDLDPYEGQGGAQNFVGLVGSATHGLNFTAERRHCLL